jgi:hypothetical protein
MAKFTLQRQRLPAFLIGLSLGVVFVYIFLEVRHRMRQDTEARLAVQTTAPLEISAGANSTHLKFIVPDANFILNPQQVNRLVWFQEVNPSAKRENERYRFIREMSSKENAENNYALDSVTEGGNYLLQGILSLCLKEKPEECRVRDVKLSFHGKANGPALHELKINKE